jgi:hypothetical protein
MASKDPNKSKMKVVYRVLHEHEYLNESPHIILRTFEKLDDAEGFCWDYEGPHELLFIQKVWVKK